MADLRMDWIKGQLMATFSLKEENVYQDLLTRDGGTAKREMETVLEGRTGEAMIFYTLTSEVEKEVEIEKGKHFI